MCELLSFLIGNVDSGDHEVTLLSNAVNNTSAEGVNTTSVKPMPKGIAVLLLGHLFTTQGEKLANELVGSGNRLVTLYSLGKHLLSLGTNTRHGGNLLLDRCSEELGQAVLFHRSTAIPHIKRMIAVRKQSVTIVSRHVFSSTLPLPSPPHFVCLDIAATRHLMFHVLRDIQTYGKTAKSMCSFYPGFLNAEALRLLTSFTCERLASNPSAIFFTCVRTSLLVSERRCRRADTVCLDVLELLRYGFAVPVCLPRNREMRENGRRKKDLINLPDKEYITIEAILGLGMCGYTRPRAQFNFGVGYHLGVGVLVNRMYMLEILLLRSALNKHEK